MSEFLELARRMRRMIDDMEHDTVMAEYEARSHPAPLTPSGATSAVAPSDGRAGRGAPAPSASLDEARPWSSHRAQQAPRGPWCTREQCVQAMCEIAEPMKQGTNLRAEMRAALRKLEALGVVRPGGE